MNHHYTHIYCILVDTDSVSIYSLIQCCLFPGIYVGLKNCRSKELTWRLDCHVSWSKCSILHFMYSFFYTPMSNIVCKLNLGKIYMNTSNMNTKKKYAKIYSNIQYIMFIHQNVAKYNGCRICCGIFDVRVRIGMSH